MCCFFKYTIVAMFSALLAIGIYVSITSVVENRLLGQSSPDKSAEDHIIESIFKIHHKT